MNMAYLCIVSSVSFHKMCLVWLSVYLRNKSDKRLKRLLSQDQTVSVRLIICLCYVAMLYKIGYSLENCTIVYPMFREYLY